MLDYENLRIGSKIKYSLLVTVVLCTTLTLLWTYFQSKTLLTEATEQRLASIRSHKKMALEEYFAQVHGHLRTTADHPYTVGALRELRDAFLQVPDSALSARQAQHKLALVQYYDVEFRPRWLQNQPDQPERSFLPNDPRARYFQHTYLAANPQPVGHKHLMASPEPAEDAYDLTHGRYHPTFEKFLAQFGYYDVFLVDARTGYIVYSVFKEIDFATSLHDGPHARANIAQVYRDVLRDPAPGRVQIVDYAEYAPSYSAPALFMGCPLYEADTLAGVLIFQLPSDKINAVMTGNGQWNDQGLGQTGEAYLISQDGTMRSDSRTMLTDPDVFVTMMEDNGAPPAQLARMRPLETTILLNQVRGTATTAIQQGHTGHAETTNYLGQTVLSSYEPVRILGLPWGVVAEITTDEVFAGMDTYKRVIPLLLLLLAAGAFVLGTWQSRLIAQPIVAAQHTIEQLAQGALPPLTRRDRRDEVGQMRNALVALRDQLAQAATFADHVGRGQFEADFAKASEADALGNALLTMRERLQQAAQEQAQRQFVSEGVAQCAALLRTRQDGALPYAALISFLVKYLRIQQGGLFVRRADAAELEVELVACYAFDRQKFVQSTVAAGEGLLGQCLLEQNTAYLTEVPADYLTITSGLGGAHPAALLMVPLLDNDTVWGAIELASLTPLAAHHIAFVEQCGTLLATTLAAESTHVRVRQMLADNQEMVAQLQAQEEEMRQQMEEMLAVQESLKA